MLSKIVTAVVCGLVLSLVSTSPIYRRDGKEILELYIIITSFLLCVCVGIGISLYRALMLVFVSLCVWFFFRSFVCPFVCLPFVCMFAFFFRLFVFEYL